MEEGGILRENPFEMKVRADEEDEATLFFLTLRLVYILFCDNK